MKDLFVNVVDKIIEPMAQYKLTFEEVKQVIRWQSTNQQEILYIHYFQFLTAYTQAVADGSVQTEKDIKHHFLRFIKTMIVITLTFYKNYKEK